MQEYLAKMDKSQQRKHIPVPQEDKADDWDDDLNQPKAVKKLRSSNS